MPHREETEIIEGEVVEIQIDRPATGTVRGDPKNPFGPPKSSRGPSRIVGGPPQTFLFLTGDEGGEADAEDDGNGNHLRFGGEND